MDLESAIREQTEKLAQLTTMLSKFFVAIETKYTSRGKLTIPPLKEGTIFQRKDGRWVARLMINGKQKHIGYGYRREEVYKKLKEAIVEKEKQKSQINLKKAHLILYFHGLITGTKFTECLRKEKKFRIIPSLWTYQS